MPAELAGVGDRVMNCRSDYQNKILVAAGGPDGGRYWRRRCGIAVTADDAVSTGRCLRLCPLLGKAGSLVARASLLRAVT